MWHILNFKTPLALQVSHKRSWAYSNVFQTFLLDLFDKKCLLYCIPGHTYTHTETKGCMEDLTPLLNKVPFGIFYYIVFFCFVLFLAIGVDLLSSQQSPQMCHTHNLGVLWALHCGQWRLAQGHKHQSEKRGGMGSWPGGSPSPPPAHRLSHACCYALWFNLDHPSQPWSQCWLAIVSSFSGGLDTMWVIRENYLAL